MVPMNQPKWKNFLSLKKNRNKVPDEFVDTNKVETVISEVNVVTNESPALENPPKKRKRTEEEIALRKAKKLKSKNKETQEWKQLSEEHEKQLSSPAAVDEDQSIAMNGGTPAEKDAPLDADKSTSLLSDKAKEIAKARREEKQEEKKQQEQLKNRGKEASVSEGKATQILEYLDQYLAHIKTGSEWKFKKPHQNWIVKHLYTFPWKSDDLVIQYLKAVQGQTRRRLIEEAKGIAEEQEDVRGEDIKNRARSLLQALNG
jgi:WKF domain